MNFNEKLRNLRKQFGFSQEQLAEKINVPRQAVTKWETDGGLPDIENLIAIAALFSVSIDELLSEEKLVRATANYAYESATEYDVSRFSHFDIHAPGALEINLTASCEEKLRVRLASNVMQALSKNYKIKIDEHRNRLDVDIQRVGQSREAEAKEALYVYISVPSAFCEAVELSAVADVLRLSKTGFPFELDGKAHRVHLEAVSGPVTLNCNDDMEITADALPAAIEVNQINATSVLRLPRDSKYYTKIKGKSNRISFAVAGNLSESHDDPSAESYVELAGMNAELLIDKSLAC